jgi:aminopeptidase YwaD
VRHRAKNRISNVAGVLIAAALAGLPAPVAAQGEDPSLAILQKISGARAYEHVLAIAGGIGSHAAGTPADRASGDYIAARLRDDGYAVTWQPFEFPYFAAKAVEVSVPSEATLVLHPQAMLYSPPTSPAGVTAELIDAGIGRPEDVAGKPLRGNIALIARGTIAFRDKAANAAAAGAVGAVIYNSGPDNFVGTLGRGITIPVVSLSGADGLQLLVLVHSGRLGVRFLVDTVTETRTTWNIIATKPGTGDPHRVLVVGGHRDTVEGAPGADDNTSGVAAVLEMASVLRPLAFPTTIRFVLFGAEELGLLGSDYYAHHMGADHVIGMVNLDMEGAGQRLQLATDRGPDTLVQLGARLAKQLGIAVQLAHTDLSDHVSFERVGVPVAFVERPDYTYLHTPKDTVNRVDPMLLETATRLATAIVVIIAGAAQ